MTTETLHINGKVHQCHFCMLSTIKKFKINDKEVWLCLLCKNKIENLGIKTEEID